MPDREKVTYDIERCICRVPDACRDCSNYQDDRLDCMEKLLADALALIKEQEAVVRCCDCKRWDSQCHSCEHFDGIMQPDFYCADGERKD